jgi:hypothetical protein
MEAAGIEPRVISSEKTSQLALGGAESGAVVQPDPLTAFVASLTPDQKAKLAALLFGGQPAG